MSGRLNPTSLKCESCGARIHVELGMDTCKCDYCGAEQIIPHNQADFPIQRVYVQAAPAYTCPLCGAHVPPQIVKRVSALGWVVFAFGLCFFIVGCLIGLLFKKEVRVCPACKGTLRSVPPPSAPVHRLPRVQATPALTDPAKKKKWAYIIGVLLVLAAIGAIIDKFDKQKGSNNSAAVSTNPTPALVADNATPSEKLGKAKSLSKAESSSADLQSAIAMLQSIPQTAKEYKEAQPLLKQDQDKLAKIKSEESLLGPKPENSAYDGSVVAADRYLRNTLNDYDSAEYLEWSPVVKTELKGQPYWAVRLKLRAKNGFGAKIVKEVIFFIRQNQVVSIVGL